MKFGNKIRELRESKGLVLRKLAMVLDIDTATMSKIEKGYRQAKRSHIPVLAKSLDFNENELKIFWLADKVVQLIEDDEDQAEEILKKAKEIVEKRNAS